MTTKEIVSKVTTIKENYQNGNISGEELCELLDDLICEVEECEGPFGMGNSDDDYYESFEETDFTKLEII
jgi:hypothetical protein